MRKNIIIDNETWFILSFSKLCDRIFYIIDSTAICNSTNTDDWSFISITSSTRSREIELRFVILIKISHSYWLSNAKRIWFKVLCHWTTRMSIIASSYCQKCTKYLTSWWERVTIRELTTDEWVHKMIDFMFIKQNAKNFNTSWTDVLERREDIRVTLSTLSHETNESIISIRRTMLSWYIDILNDHELIKNMKIEMWIELIAIYRDLIVVRTFLFDFFNKYDAILYKFSTAMKVINLKSLSDALIERRRWDTLAILAERDLWLREDSNNTQF
jgi:hypothetical protein